MMKGCHFSVLSLVPLWYSRRHRFAPDLRKFMLPLLTSMARILLFSLFISLNLFVSLVEIRFTEIRSDYRPIIPFDEFGFTHTGRLELNVTNIILSNLNSDLDCSKLGFFLCTRDAWMHVLQQLEDNEISCAIQSDFIKTCIRFQSEVGVIRV